MLRVRKSQSLPTIRGPSDAFSHRLHLRPYYKVAMVKAQRSSMQGWYDGQNDYLPIAEFWLETILGLYKEAAKDI